MNNKFKNNAYKKIGPHISLVSFYDFFFFLRNNSKSQKPQGDLTYSTFASISL